LKEAAYEHRLHTESKPSLQSEGSTYSVLVDVQNNIQYQYYDHYKSKHRNDISFKKLWKSGQISSDYSTLLSFISI